MTRTKFDKKERPVPAIIRMYTENGRQTFIFMNAIVFSEWDTSLINHRLMTYHSQDDFMGPSYRQALFAKKYKEN